MNKPLQYEDSIYIAFSPHPPISPSSPRHFLQRNASCYNAAAVATTERHLHIQGIWCSSGSGTVPQEWLLSPSTASKYLLQKNTPTDTGH
ncbi:MAG: hypothetical protein AAF915_01835 [Cyanobacteria bacterium P01_D01_bin.50]